MALDPPPLISREPARNRRRRRRAQQQSSCCCCSLVLVCLLIVLIAWRGSILSVLRSRSAQKPNPAAAFPLDLQTDHRAYLRYNIVRLSAKLVDAQGRAILAAQAPEVTVTRAHELVTTVGKIRSVRLQFDRNSQSYSGSWPIPWNAQPGEYVAEARVLIDQPQSWIWETPEQRERRQEEQRRKHEQPAETVAKGPSYCTARARFSINARPLAQIPPGTCIATWEPDFSANDIPKPDGTTGDWRAMLDWCEFMGADTFWYRGAVTEVPYRGQLTNQEPFNSDNIKVIPQLAAAAHQRHLRFGSWAAAYATYPRGNNRGKPPYIFAKDISRSTGTVTDLDFISLFDRTRIEHLSNFLGSTAANPNVDYVGLDYMRSDRGGYEMVDRFTSEMPLQLPTGFSGWSQTKRWQWVARKVENEWQTDPNFYDAWNWWRAHLTAQNLNDMISQARLNKPLWIFVLSWWHGKQHGQDPAMFMDAGASLLAPMLYQVPNRAHFDSMVSDWNEYLSSGQANLAPGDQVDFYWHQKTLNPAAPEELYDRMVTAHQQYLRGGNTIGSFVHDISRAADWGDKGPYPGSEWALAAGAAFTTLRTDWQVYPLTAAWAKGDPTGASFGSECELHLELANTTRKTIKQITVQVETTAGVQPLESGRTIASLGPGEAHTIPIRIKLKAPNAARGNRFMVAVRVRWPEGDYGDKVRADLPRMMIMMKYLQGR